jgi:hypothetical protein
MGGEEINSEPRHSPHRFVIDFRDRELDACRQRWPSALGVVEQKVKPERTRRNLDGTFVLRKPLPERWWHHADKRPALFRAKLRVPEVIVKAQTSKQLAFAICSSDITFSHSVIVFPSESRSLLALLQSNVHDLWTRAFASSMKDDPVYTPSDCFDTFPFPKEFESNEALECTGREYYDFRAALMVKNDEGLTKTYNRFHDRDNREPDIVRLRELHTAMDRAVLDAYGWHDIKTDCDFFADYTEEDEDGNEVEKSIRYRWPDEVRDEVLARLLALNAERHAEEVKLGLVSPDGKRLKRADDDENGDDEADAADAKPTKAGSKKSPASKPKSAKGKKANLTGQLDFGGDA